MTDILIDSNVLLDVLECDPTWLDWSRNVLFHKAADNILVINPVIYAEISIGFQRMEDVDEALRNSLIQNRPFSKAVAFLAGKCFVKYRRAGGTKTSPLPDFFIGAHAAVEKMPLITRDAARYRTYFPTVELITPE